MAHKKSGGSSRNGRDSAGQRLGVKKFGGEDDVGGFLLHVALDERHGHAGQPAAEGLKPAQQSPVERREKAWHALRVENVREVLGGAAGGLATECLVGELNERGFVRGRLQHAVQFRLLTAFGWRLQFTRPRLKRAGQRNGLFHCRRVDFVGHVRLPSPGRFNLNSKSKKWSAQGGCCSNCLARPCTKQPGPKLPRFGARPSLFWMNLPRRLDEVASGPIPPKAFLILNF